MYTIQMCSWRKAKTLGIPLLDVTVKSGDKTFAPTWSLTSRFKKGVITFPQFSAEYSRLMRKSFMDNKERWLEVCSMECVALACYCNDHNHCHRQLLLAMFEKVCKNRGLEFEQGGEI